jgi:hypothetical protein
MIEDTRRFQADIRYGRLKLRSEVKADIVCRYGPKIPYHDLDDPIRIELDYDKWSTRRRTQFPSLPELAPDDDGRYQDNYRL